MLGLPTVGVITLEDMEAAYRMKARLYHPDRGGDQAAMAELNSARDRAAQELTNS